MDKDEIIEIAQVANGFIVRPAHGWFGQDGARNWPGGAKDYLVFRSMAELLEFTKQHFSHRSSVPNPDRDA